jgi:hypothetical protein
MVVTPNVTQDTKFAGAVYEKLAREQAKILQQAFALRALSNEPSPEKAKIAASELSKALHAVGLPPVQAQKSVESYLSPLLENTGVSFGFGAGQNLWIRYNDRQGVPVTAVFDASGAPAQEQPGEDGPGGETEGKGTFGFTKGDVRKIVINYLMRNTFISGVLNINPVAFNLEEMAEGMVNHLFGKGKSVELLSEQEARIFENERAAMEREIAVFKVKHPELMPFTVRVELVHGDLIPVSTPFGDMLSSGMLFAGKMNGNELTLRVTEGFLNIIKAVIASHRIKRDAAHRAARGCP